jgi:UDP-N-acetylglucosamine--N-acetylmuramyl-(pentapeptide) pyrophosphoryl-undecaprenol N-acetylglucosamine transferase
MKDQLKVIISGGGTGGHIFPAISIAKALQEKVPECEILFIGAKNRMEMQKIPQAGYEIIGLPVEGLVRKISIKNLRVAINLLISLSRAQSIINSFKPDVVVGVGGFASGPVLRIANKKNVPTLIQEQNSYPGITNKLLAKKAQKICVAYEGMEKYFPADKIVLTGNPVRKDILVDISHQEAFDHFRMKPTFKTLLVIGGSLGARTINQSIAAGIDKFIENGIQVIWQTGKYYIDEATKIEKETNSEYLHVKEFIHRMDYAFNVADLVISRAGAGTISELCLTGKPVILVPSPNVAEDHQTKNAMALVKNEAAVLITDSESQSALCDTASRIIDNENKLYKLEENITKMAIKNSDEIIVDEILKLVN